MSGFRHAPTPAAALLLTLVLAACSDRPTTSEPRPPLASAVVPGPSAAEVQLGKAIFFDSELSLDRNQSCAACHAAETGFKGPISAVNAHGAVYEGSVTGRFGNRAPPSAAYATFAPVFQFSRHAGGVLIGGNFWDGRATGLQLGNPSAEQARGPFLNPAEQALPDMACVVYRVVNAPYAGLFAAVWGTALSGVDWADAATVCGQEGATVALAPSDRAKVATAYDQVAFSIAAFEASPEVNAFSSKFDAWRKGMAQLTAEEQRGYVLFQSKGNCVNCHPDRGQQALFTDFSYDNLGAPANPENPVYQSSPGFVDYGLGGPGGALPGEEQWGMMKVPTLRNVTRSDAGAVKSYLHNGVFKSLEEVVHFYNTRDVLPTCGATAPRADWGVSCWPAPEVSENVNRDELGNLGLTSAEEAAIVAFVKTLNDGWR